MRHRVYFGSVRRVTNARPQKIQSLNMVPTNAEAPIRIIKLGGSLLHKKDLAQDLQRWLSQQSKAHHIIIVGGGGLADEVRTWSHSHDFDEGFAHDLCIQLLSITARAVAALCEPIPLVDDIVAATSDHPESLTCVFDAARFLNIDEPLQPGTPLPHTWSATSDSIAARVAIVASAQELVLLKSTAPPPELTVHVASQSHYVDEFFPTLSPELPPIRCVNFRDPSFPEWPLHR